MHGDYIQSRIANATNVFCNAKDVCATKRIAKGSIEKLKLGHLDVTIDRGWGLAPEYWDDIRLMLQ